MGVMACSRPECKNIMCDTYIDSVGYTCGDCQSEFKEYVQEKELSLTTERQITEALKKFMDTTKNKLDDKEQTTISEFFSKHSK